MESNNTNTKKNKVFSKCESFLQNARLLFFFRKSTNKSMQSWAPCLTKFWTNFLLHQVSTDFPRKFKTNWRQYTKRGESPGRSATKESIQLLNLYLKIRNAFFLHRLQCYQWEWGKKHWTCALELQSIFGTTAQHAKWSLENHCTTKISWREI